MTSVAIIGTSGLLGNPVLTAFQNPVVGTFKYPIKAITTKDKVSTDKIQYVKKEIDDPELAKELAGIDVIISLANPNPVLLSKIENLIKVVKPKVYIPSDFGFPHDDVKKVFPKFGPKTFHIEQVSKIDGVKVVSVSNSCFKFGPFLNQVFAHVGIDTENNTVTYFTNPEDARVAVTTDVDIANSVVAISATEPSKLLNHYRIQSEETTVKVIAEQYERDNGVTLKPIFKDIKKETEVAIEKLKGGFDVKDLLFYLSVIVGNGVDHGSSYSSNETEVLNPGEKYWKWSKNY